MKKVRGVLLGESILDWAVLNGRDWFLDSYGAKKSIMDIEIENPTTRNDVYDYICVVYCDEHGNVCHRYEDLDGNSLMDCDIFMLAVSFCGKRNIYDTMREFEAMVF